MSLSSTPHINISKGLIAMAEIWQKLTSITLQRCTFGEDALELFITKAQNLKHLTIECCCAIRKRKVEDLSATHPNLNIQFTPSVPYLLHYRLQFG
eukprot:m.51497 g.51497  ORF g.51497 m.51497 type:complete len:96 (-) comp21456_c0_seq1:203-490(-)